MTCGAAPLADPLRRGLTADIEELAACVQEAQQLAAQLAAGELSDEERASFAGDAYEHQVATAFVVAGLLKDDEELRAATGLLPEDLLELLKKEALLLRLHGALEQARDDCADGRALAGALFDFYEERALRCFERRLRQARWTPDAELAGLQALLRAAREDRAPVATEARSVEEPSSAPPPASRERRKRPRED